MRIPGSPAPRKKSATTDQPQAASMPTEISVSIVAAPCFRFCQAARWNGQAPQSTTGVASSEREPLPVVELELLEHREQQDGERDMAAEKTRRRRSDAVGSSSAVGLARRRAR